MDFVALYILFEKNMHHLSNFRLDCIKFILEPLLKFFISDVSNVPFKKQQIKESHGICLV